MRCSGESKEIMRWAAPARCPCRVCHRARDTRPYRAFSGVALIWAKESIGRRDSNQVMSVTDWVDEARAALQTVLDPELGESVVELGLVERIGRADMAAGPCVEVVLIPTSAACPMTDMLIRDATEAVAQALPSGWTAWVRLDFDVPWPPTRMSPALQDRFGWFDEAEDGR